MRISPTKLLHGLLCTTPILLLTLAACGGGGDSTPTVPLAAAYTVGGAASGVSAGGLVLRNNGGDDLPVASMASSYTFGTSVIAATSYNVTVLTNPVNLKCSVANASGTMPAYNVTNANVSCVTAYKIGGTIAGDPLATGLVLQNNGGDNLLVPAGSTSFSFSAPIADGDSYSVTVLTQPHTPAQTCIPTANSGGPIAGNVTTVLITCTNNIALPAPDAHVYTANFGSANVSTYSSASGVLTSGGVASAGSGPYSIAVDPGSQFAYVVNFNTDNISASSINSFSGALTALTDVDGGTVGNQASIATGDGPRAIAIDPSGKFAYVANYLANSVSAYSIDASGVLARIDSNGATMANETSIPAKVGPQAIVINPAGGYAYVANADGNVSTYSIDTTSGALTAIPANGAPGSPTFILAGSTPSSITVDPSGHNLYVANAGSADISSYGINPADGSLTSIGTFATVAGGNPQSVAVDPNGQYLYVVNAGTTINAGDRVWVYDIAAGVLSFKSKASAGTVPISISIDSTGQYAYVANSGSNDISAYSISAGVLTRINCGCGGPDFPAGTSPYAVTTAR